MNYLLQLCLEMLAADVIPQGVSLEYLYLRRYDLFCIMSAIRSPLSSFYGEYHVCEYTFMSPVTMLFLSCVI